MIAGRYELIEQIGVGGTAVVWRAVDTVLDRQVAVKRLLPALAADPSAVERFRREAQMAARLSHPNILTVHDAGEDGEGPYIVMELIGGETLADRLARQGPLSPTAVSDLVEQVAAGLDHAHAAGLVHRDIKPANLILEPEGRVRIADFGTVRGLSDDAGVTATGEVVGTLAYLAPEIIDGAPPSPSSDVYSLGVVAFECLSGEPPFVAATTGATLDAIRSQDLPPLPAAPGEMEDVIRSATAKDPSDRPASAGELAARLRRGSTLVLPSGGGIPPERETRPPDPDRPTVVLARPPPSPGEHDGAGGTGRSWPAARWAGAVLGLAALGAVALAALSLEEEPVPPPAAEETSTTSTTVATTSTTSTTAPSTTAPPTTAVPRSEVDEVSASIDEVLGELEPPEFKPPEVRELGRLVDEAVESWEEGDGDEAIEKLDTAEEKLERLTGSKERRAEEVEELADLLDRLRRLLEE